MHVREWDNEKVAAFLQERLKTWAADKHLDFEMKMIVSRQTESRFENWKPEKRKRSNCILSSAKRALVMEGIKLEDHLSE